jgi:hypothetical protein
MHVVKISGDANGIWLIVPKHQQRNRLTDGLMCTQWPGRILSNRNGRIAQAISRQWLYGNGMSLPAIDRLMDVLRWLFGNSDKMD